MNSSIRAVLLSLFLPTVLLADPKYGVFAESDEGLLLKARSVEIDEVVLGCVYKYIPPTKTEGPPSIKDKVYTSFVTVIESYKGELDVGQKIVVITYAEQGPLAPTEEGNLRFLLLRKKASDSPSIPDGGYFCDWTDQATYARYGEPLRLVLQSIKGANKK